VVLTAPESLPTFCSPATLWMIGVQNQRSRPRACGPGETTVELTVISSTSIAIWLK
jgi:hypothetical protein